MNTSHPAPSARLPWELRLLLPSAALALSLACGGSESPSAPGPKAPEDIPGVAAVRLEPATATLLVGEQLQLEATALDDGDEPLGDVPASAFRFHTSDPLIASVDDAGLVTAIEPGEVEIIASVGSVQGKGTLTVVAATLEELEITAPAGRTFRVGTTLQLEALGVGPGGAPLPLAEQVVWTSKHPDVASIDEDGEVTGLRPGLALIEAEIGEVRAELWIAAVLHFESVAAGQSITCGTTLDHLGYCWGDLRFAGGSTTTSIPRRVLEDKKIAQFSLGTRHGCALTDEQELWCWGSNEQGQLGQGDLARHEGPVRVGSLEVQAFEVKRWNTCALTVEEEVFCWGLHVGETLEEPTLITGLPSTIDRVMVGGSHACAGNASELRCWGSNVNGQIDPTDEREEISSPVALEIPGFAIESLSLGSQHSCAVGSGAAGAELRCWGMGNQGQTGDPSFPLRGAVNQVEAFDGPNADILVDLVAVWSGSTHSCGVTDKGRAFCWGSNGRGELSLPGGSPVPAPRPVNTSEPTAFESLAPGAVHSCGLSAEGVVRCWGSGKAGELGSGDNDSPYPRVVHGQLYDLP